jgi:hypothetical protein
MERNQSMLVDKQLLPWGTCDEPSDDGEDDDVARCIEIRTNPDNVTIQIRHPSNDIDDQSDLVELLGSNHEIAEFFETIAKLIRGMASANDRHNEKIDSKGMKGKVIEISANDERLKLPIDVLEPTIRLENRLILEGLQTIGDVVKLSKRDFLNMKNLGCVSIRLLEEKLTSLGLSLGMKIIPEVTNEAPKN